MSGQQTYDGNYRIVYTLDRLFFGDTFQSKTFTIGDNYKWLVRVSKCSADNVIFEMFPEKNYSNDLKVKYTKYWLITDTITHELGNAGKPSQVVPIPATENATFVCDMLVSFVSPIRHTKQWFESTTGLDSFKEMTKDRILEIARKTQMTETGYISRIMDIPLEEPIEKEDTINKERSVSSSESSAGMILSKFVTKSYKDKQFCDVTIKVQRSYSEIPAHKVVLVSGSTTWEQLLTDDAQLSIINVPEFEHQTIEALVNFIYDGSVPEHLDGADQLLVAAETYGVQGLKDWCEQQLMNTITIDTVVHLLLLSHRYKAPALFERIVPFVRENFATIELRDDWKSTFLM